MEITPEIAELFGAYVGDGSMTKLRNGATLLSIYASNEEKDWLNHLASIFENSFSIRPVVRWCTKEYAIRIGTNRVCRFFQNAGFPVGEKTHTARVPPAIIEYSDKHLIQAFIKGYFDADGSLGFHNRGYNEKYCKDKKIFHYYPRIYLESASRDLICVDVKSMLDYLNFRCRVYKRKRCGGKYSACAIVIKGVPQLGAWMSKIKSSNPVQITKYQVWKKYGFCPPRTTLNQRLAILSDKINPIAFIHVLRGDERARG